MFFTEYLSFVISLSQSLNKSFEHANPCYRAQNGILRSSRFCLTITKRNDLAKNWMILCQSVPVLLILIEFSGDFDKIMAIYLSKCVAHYITRERPSYLDRSQIQTNNLFINKILFISSLDSIARWFQEVSSKGSLQSLCRLHHQVYG